MIRAAGCRGMGCRPGRPMISNLSHAMFPCNVEAGQSLMSCSAPGRPLQRVNSFRAVAEDATLIEPVR